ncbi:MAG: response regulator [Anaerolineae bacterium]|nr:response regulator [Anaerolineae bacterium]
MKSQNLHIVYIEDDPEMVDLVALILTRHGYKVSSAYSGSEGLEIIQKTLPDLILLDIMMPDMDGWEVYQKLKRQQETKNIPTIIITAKSQPVDRVLGLHIAKVDDFIAKPFHPQELLESIERVLEKQKQ